MFQFGNDELSMGDNAQQCKPSRQKSNSTEIDPEKLARVQTPMPRLHAQTVWVSGLQVLKHGGRRESDRRGPPVEWAGNQKLHHALRCSLSSDR